MKVNFEIVDNHALSTAEAYIDLHNNFDFIGHEYNPEEKELRLSWKRAMGEWVDKNEFSSIILAHSQVSFLRIPNPDENGNDLQGLCLTEMSYFPSNEREINDHFLLQSKPNDDDDIIYSFENGLCIRVHCKEIELQVNTDKPRT